VISLLSEAENVARGASSPREGDLAPHLQRLKSTLKALGELRVTFPDPPDVRSSPSAAKGRKRLYGREDGDEDDAESTEAPKGSSQGSRKNSISTPPPLPLSTVEGADDAETDTPREDSGPAASFGLSAGGPGKPPPPSRGPPPRQGAAAAAEGFNLSNATSTLAELGQNLSALSSTLSQVPAPGARPSASPAATGPPAARPSSAVGSRAGNKAPGAPERQDKVSAPLRPTGGARPSSAAGSRAQAPAPTSAAQRLAAASAATGSALKAVQKARGVSSGWTG